MTPAETSDELSPRHRQVLQRAYVFLERPDFAARLSEYAGQPIHRLMRAIPRSATDRLNKAVEAAVLNCLHVAIRSLDGAPRRRPASRASAMLAGLGGGVSGFFGAVALPVELPLTTTLMLRSIAEIARHHGEDLSTLEARLACVEVLGLGSPKPHVGMELGYYATRALLSRLVGDASSLLIERGVAGASAPAVTGFLAEIMPRFGLVVSERASASALPVIGAFGGATINLLFMSHFQRIAHGHFTIRRLERQYGAGPVRRYYQGLSARRIESAT
jgi:hypothetical protein